MGDALRSVRLTADRAPLPFRRRGTDFDDLLAANQEYAAHFDLGGFDGIAHAGIAIITCMDSRIDPLRMLGLTPGDAKIFRNPGGRVTPQALEALVLGVHLLNVERILVIPHTRCAMTASTEAELREQIAESAGVGRRLAGLPRGRGPARRARGRRRRRCAPTR